MDVSAADIINQLTTELPESSIPESVSALVDELEKDSAVEPTRDMEELVKLAIAQEVLGEKFRASKSWASLFVNPECLPLEISEEEKTAAFAVNEDDPIINELKFQKEAGLESNRLYTENPGNLGLFILNSFNY